MRRMIAFLTGFSVVAVGAVAFGFVMNGAPPDGGSASQPPSNVITVDKPASTLVTSPKVEEVSKVEPIDDKPPVTEPIDDKPPVTEPIDDKPPVTEPIDETPPPLAILHPVNGQVFETKEVVFEGTTEAGARVFAGPYEADVRDDGSWRIVLFLSPGENRATFVAKDASGNLTDAAVSVVLAVKEPEEQPKGEFSAFQQYGECSENPPYDVFYGTARPGSKITVFSEFGDGVTEVNDSGHWEIKVTFPESPIGLTFLVKVKDSDGHSQAFEFKHTG